MIELRDLRKSYNTGGFVQKALDGVSACFRDAEFVAILGPSGSGKTTLLNVIGGLDHADTGELVIDGVSTKDYGAKAWDTYRNHHVGFVFQSYNLIPHQSVLKNVELALTLSGVSRSERHRRAEEALRQVGLAEHLNKKPSQLSGGQMQRVAIARALVNDPDIVLADEPTGALDTETGVQVMELLAVVARDRLVVMVTHNPELAEQYASRIIRIADGRVIDDSDPFAPAGQSVPAKQSVPAGQGVSAKQSVPAGQSVPAKQSVPAGHGLISERIASPVDKDTKHLDKSVPQHASIDKSAARHASIGKGSKRHASMSFLTALSLSFANLMAKKGRTFLTAFAGSIGIMGIAAILALSNGVNNYIDKVQEDVLSSSPLTITESSFDITSIMTQAASYEGSDETGAVAGDDVIPETTIMSDILTDVKTNDLESFRAYLEGGSSGIESHVNAITYSYGITPYIYKADTSDGIKQLNPSSLSSIMSNGMSSLMRSGTSSNMGFQEMLDDQALLDEQYEVVRGSWPKSYDECVLVLSDSGGVSDYTLYSLGVLDPDVLKDLLTATVNSEKVDVPDAQVEVTYDDILNLSFKVVNLCNTFTRSEDGRTWTDRSKDEDFMKGQVAKGIDLHVVGIVRPRPTASSTSLGEGIAYRHDLILHLMDDAANSTIVKEQLDDPDVDVFTGKTFDELQEAQSAELDMSSLFSIDEDAVTRAFSIDESKMQVEGIDPSAFDFSGLTLEGLDDVDITIDQDAIAQSVQESLAQNIPAPESSDLGLSEPEGMSDLMSALGVEDVSELATLDPTTIDPAVLASIDPATLAAVSAYGQTAQALGVAVGENYPKIVQGYIAYLSQHLSSGETPSQASYVDMMEDYLSGDGKQYLDAIAAATGDDPAQQQATREAFTKYLTRTVAPNVYASLLTATTQATAQASAQALEQVQTQLQEQLAKTLSEQLSKVMQEQMSGLASKIQNAVSFDPDVFASAIQVKMDQDDLTSLLTNYMNAEELTYDNNLKKLGYADIDKPRAISIYAKSFDDKQEVEDIIAAYNTQVEDAGEKDKSISYSDITGVLMGSVSDIINMISMVLIAFVSVSLVVSSIMIGIITYISVLERRKEIGILRAMGASKFNVANIFNAETVIEGLFAGLLAIAAVIAASIPINMIVERDHAVQNIMSLPPRQALLLITISVVLTFIAGLIPSMAASRRDPVEALRSE